LAAARGCALPPGLNEQGRRTAALLCAERAQYALAQTARQACRILPAALVALLPATLIASVAR
jgi:hypothetical protein